MENQLSYALIEVGGIQNFILGTGKLKEMLAGSELVEMLSKDFLDKVCSSLQLTQVQATNAHCPQPGEVLIKQSNAGSMHLIFASHKEAKKFISTYCLKALEKYPGLPLFAAIQECAWEKSAISKAQSDLKSRINLKRAMHPTSIGMHTHPLCRNARLDGLPAVSVDNGETISLPSQTKRLPELIEKAKRRLEDIDDEKYRKPGTASDILMDWSRWENNIDAIGSNNGKVAFIHMDGNDLGKLFTSRLKDDSTGNLTIAEKMRQMGELSQNVADSTKDAFNIALRTILRFELKRLSPPFRFPEAMREPVPARPLVLGGDDVTAVVKADLALLFISTFVREFEKLSQEHGQRLSVSVGMVVCPASYPFLKAFTLAEELLKNAKQMTAQILQNRPSSLDYVVLTNDVENNISSLRKHIHTSTDKELLTGKPFLLQGNTLHDFVQDGHDVLTRLPRATIRPAMNDCRKGERYAMEFWRTLEWNIERRLGGRKDMTLMTSKRFHEIFPNKSFFRNDHSDGRPYTLLGDYLELAHLLPEEEFFNEYLELLNAGSSGSEEGSHA